MRRSWPWLLVAGVALTFFAELAYPLHWTATTGDAAPFVQGTVTAGAHLVLLGTLGAGLVLVRIGAAGAVVLVTLLYLRYEGRPELAGPPDSEPAVGRLAALAGAAGALLFVPAAIGDGGHGVTASWLLPAAGLAFSALAGPRAVAGTLVASAVVAGVSGPAGALIQTASIEPVRMWFWAALGRRAARPG